MRPSLPSVVKKAIQDNLLIEVALLLLQLFSGSFPIIISGIHGNLVDHIVSKKTLFLIF